MKLKNWMYYTFSATCFLISGVMNYLEASYVRSAFLLSFTGLLYILAAINFKKKDQVKKMLSVDEVEHLESELRILLENTDKIGAIKKYREITGVSLKEATDYIEEIMVSKKELDLMDIELRNLIFDGKNNEAIKKYRDVTGANLQEAHDYVESLM